MVEINIKVPEGFADTIGKLKEDFGMGERVMGDLLGGMRGCALARLLTGVQHAYGKIGISEIEPKDKTTQEITCDHGLGWAKPEGGNLFAELEAACERVSMLRTPVIVVPDEATRDRVQGLVDEHGLDAEIIIQQEYWEREAALHLTPLFPPSLPFELTPDGPRNRKERRHGRDY